MATVSGDMLRGHLEGLVLATLEAGETHGYQVMQCLNAEAQGAITLVLKLTLLLALGKEAPLERKLVLSRYTFSGGAGKMNVSAGVDGGRYVLSVQGGAVSGFARDRNRGGVRPRTGAVRWIFQRYPTRSPY